MVHQTAVGAEKTSTSPLGFREEDSLQDERDLYSIAMDRHPSYMSPAPSVHLELKIRPAKRQKQSFDTEEEPVEKRRSASETCGSRNAMGHTINAAATFETRDTADCVEAYWDTDTTSPLTMEYLDLYFFYINGVTYNMLPKGPFLKWVRDCQEKTIDDQMVLHTLMAMGCRFSAREESTAHGKRLLQIAHDAEQNCFGKFTLQLVQTRLILALLNFSLGKFSEAWDYCGTAVRAICGLKYNCEEAVSLPDHSDEISYGLNSRALTECRRRTFWSAYMMDVSLLTSLTRDPSYPS